MLAVNDPEHPGELRELARWSGELYDGFVAEIEAAGGGRVQYQTLRTRLISGDQVQEIAERSLDPRELMRALEAAVPAVRCFGVVSDDGGELRAADGRSVQSARVLWTEGAWAKRVEGVRPRKGQMLCVEIPAGAERDVVLRGEDVYVVPRTHGAMAGRALVGATVEDVGFDLRVEVEALEQLRTRAAQIAPWVSDAQMVDAWSGLRPGTDSALPVMGRVGEREFVATGHFRNGILLAPATAQVMADMVEGKPATLDVGAFALDTDR
jgi:glycine oxidase